MAKIALLIGVSDYEPGLNPLPAAVKDVTAMQQILKDPELGGFDEVKSLTNPDTQVMQYEIETLFTAGRSKDDLVLLFFSGHGIKDDGNNLYFASRITKKNQKGELIRATAVSARSVHEVMNNTRAKRQVIILDCCFSGAFDPALHTKDDGSLDLQGQLGAEGRVVLTSSSSTQYSFEQHGSELSLYTRYLVEGIETGAADRDEDGKISIRELHDYATSKVQETAPNMTPKLITLKDMGFEIVLAKAKITDPRLRYRRQVERCASRGAISSVGRTILDKLQTQLGLSLEVAIGIETEVLRPYQERLENLQRYQHVFLEAVEYEYPLSSHVQSELEDLRQILGLRREDVDSIKQEILAQADQKLDAKQKAYQQNLQLYKQKFLNLAQHDYPASYYTRNELKKLQQSLKLKDKDIDEVESNIITIIATKREDYQRKLQHYEQNFLNILQTNGSVNETSRNMLRKLQQDLLLQDKDVAAIEAKNQAQVTAYKEEYRKKLQRYKSVFYEKIKSEYPFSNHTRNELNSLAVSLKLKSEDVTAIEVCLISSFVPKNDTHKVQSKELSPDEWNKRINNKFIGFVNSLLEDK